MNRESIYYAIFILLALFFMGLAWHYDQPRTITIDGVECIRSGRDLDCNWNTP